VYQAEPILLSETADIALILLKGPVPDLYPIRLGTKVPDLLTPVLVIGYPEATRMDAKPLVTLSPGVVGSLRYIEEYLDCIQIDVHASPGSSGSPVLDRETGELLGIISKGLLNGGMFFAVPCEELASLLKTVGIPG
jgi:S1-C subfamily serine protease